MGGLVNEEEWSDIIRYMYSHEDATVLIVRVKELARATRGGSGGGGGGGGSGAAARPGNTSARTPRGAPPPAKPPPYRLPYASFLKVLLDFQLAGHQQFLSHFLRLWREHDPEARGVVAEGAFRRLVLALDPSKDAPRGQNETAVLAAPSWLNREPRGFLGGAAVARRATPRHTHRVFRCV